jgi:uncharacterized protein
MIDLHTNHIFLSSKELDLLVRYFTENNGFNPNLSNFEIEKLCIDNKCNKANLIAEWQRLKFLIESGYISTKKENYIYYNKMDKNFIDSNIANTKQIVIQTTERCNLNCEYCIDGNMYRKKDLRKRKNLSIEDCLFFLKEIMKQQHSALNLSRDKILYITFYGGEPLINFPLIKEVIHFIKSQKTTNIDVQYSITTNGTLLNKYSLFLVRNNFKISISLDGDNENNCYRYFYNKKKSYNIVYKNIQELKRNYPDFFSDNVSFLSVLHDKNNVSDLYNFFIREFKKIPTISTLTQVEHYEI